MWNYKLPTAASRHRRSSIAHAGETVNIAGAHHDQFVMSAEDRERERKSVEAGTSKSIECYMAPETSWCENVRNETSKAIT